MNSAVVEIDAPDVCAFPDSQWEILLALMEEKQVVPVVGPELIQIVDPEDGEEKTLVSWLAGQLELRLGKVSLSPSTNGDDREPTLDRYVSGFVRAGGSARDVYANLYSLLKDTDFEPSETVKKLARIPHFNLYITMTFDPVLKKALDQERCGGRDETQSLAYSPNKVTDLPAPKESLTSPLVYHLLGRVSPIPRSFAVSDEDTLEWMAGLQSSTFTPELLAQELENSQLLLLGLHCDDWLARFFIRMAKRRRLSDRRDFGEIVADRRLGQNSHLREFLSAFSRDTLIFPEAGAAEFVDTLYSRCQSESKAEPLAPTTGPADVSSRQGTEPVRFLPPEIDMPPNAIFISYSRDDMEAVKRIKAQLDAAGIVTWFDMDRLESGDDYRQKIEKNIAACSYFLPVLSGSTAARTEAFFRREWNWACDRLDAMPEGALFIFPILLDDAENFEKSLPPRKILSANYTPAPGGELPNEFVTRLKALAEGTL